jgi:hypothetical protein
MVDDEILRRLDLIQATLQLAFAPQLLEAREKIRGDEVAAAILDASKEWISSTELQQKVAKAAKVTGRSVRDRFPSLLEQRVLEARGTERRMEYRSTGII